MEQQVIQLLTETQSSADGSRQQAERQLQELYHNESFPLTLCSIAAQQSTIALPIQQAALLSLKNYVLAGWSPQLDEFKGQVFASDAAKAQVRDAVLSIATSGTADRRAQSAAAYVVSKIASADFPDLWPGLLPTLLQLVPGASDPQLHGTLKVLAELVDDGFNEDQYFRVAGDLVNTLFAVAANESRRPNLRALAVAIFRSSFNILEMVMEDHKADVNIFAEEALKAWLPLFLTILKTALPPEPSDEEKRTESGPRELYRGWIALKLQVAKALMRIKEVFSSILLPKSPDLFTAMWEELSTLLPAYQASHVETGEESRLEDADGLPYTLDFLVLEDLDFMQACIRASPVKKELEKRLKADQDANRESWTIDVMRLAVSYAQITSEEEGMWEIDVNVFLAEETSVTANYTARAACGDLIIKLGEWLREPTIEALLTFSNSLYASNATWRVRESALYILNQVLGDWQDFNFKIVPAVANGFLELAKNAMQQSDMFLRARGYLAAASVIKTASPELHATALPLLESALSASLNDAAEVVQVAGIRATQLYLQALPKELTLPVQANIITALSQWLAAQDVSELKESDDLMMTFLETLRDAIVLDTRICLSGEGLNLLFNIASQGAENFQIADLVSEVFEDICLSIASSGPDLYSQLCQRVLPSLTGAFDVADLTEENALTNLAAEMLSNLAEHAPAALPAGFVATVMPKLNRQLMHSTDDELLKACTTSLRFMLKNDTNQLFAWQDESGKSGLEVVLVIIDRLLGPTVDDNAAAEVGGLAAETVERAGAERLGPFLTQLLRAVAIRLSTAVKAQLIQSLILVFARLCLNNPNDVVEFLAQVQVDDQNNGLQAVLAKWLENSVYFVGVHEIRQNVMALTKLYQLNDARVGQVAVKGDLIMPASSRIMTRSRTRENPDQYTIVHAPLKIIKVLVGELQSGSGPSEQTLNATAAAAGAGADASAASINEAANHTSISANGNDGADGDDDEDSDEWEDEPNAFDLGLGTTKAELMAYADADPSAARATDDETQAFLVSFFREMATNESPEVKELVAGLTDEERQKVSAVV